MEMNYGKTRTWLEVDLKALEENYRKIREKIDQNADMIVVVKADAYGLGAVETARTLERAGCRYFATAYLQEAVELRESGIQSSILVLGGILPEEVPVAMKNRLEVSVSSIETAEVYGEYAGWEGGELTVHIAADVGMSRFGIRLEEGIISAAEEAERIIHTPGICTKGVMTHITGMSKPWQREFDLYQLELFRTFVNELRKRGYQLMAHCACSAAVLLYPDYNMDAVRIGALPFGVQNQLYQDFQVSEVIQLKSRVWHLKDVPLHATVGYGPHYTERKTRLAVIPVGFGDGLHRSISHRLEVLIHGQRARIFGKLCMDFTMIDVTDIKDVRVGDEVVLFGTQNGETVSIQEYAEGYGGTACEVSTSLGKRINRIYVK